MSFLHVAIRLNIFVLNCVHYDPSKELILSCDSSSYGIGCVLLQTNGTGNFQPVAYGTQPGTLSGTERLYAQVQREALACVWGTLKMHQYVFGRYITIETDHKPLFGLLGETRAILPTSSGRVQRWALTLAGYDYSLVYHPGKEMYCADMLSHFPVSVTIPEPPQSGDIIHLMANVIQDEAPVTAKQIACATNSNPDLSQIKHCVMSGNWASRLEGAKHTSSGRMGSLLMQTACFGVAE